MFYAAFTGSSELLYIFSTLGPKDAPREKLRGAIMPESLKRVWGSEMLMVGDLGKAEEMLNMVFDDLVDRVLSPVYPPQVAGKTRYGAFGMAEGFNMSVLRGDEQGASVCEQANVKAGCKCASLAMSRFTY